MASQAGSMRLAAWEALRSHSHCPAFKGEERDGEAGRRGGSALRLLQLWALGGGPPGLASATAQGGGDTHTKGAPAL